MSRKSVKTKLLGSAFDLSEDFQTDWVNIAQLDNVGFLISTSGVTENDGTFAVEVRNKLSDSDYSEEAELTLSGVPTLNNTDFSTFLNLNQVPADQIRVTFTAPASGTPDGTAEISIHSKTVGA